MSAWAAAAVGDLQSPDAFLNTVRQIASCDLREIDHIAQIVGSKASISPEMIDVDGRRILGWIDVRLESAQIGYGIAIQDAPQISWPSKPKDYTGPPIAVMSFTLLPTAGCIDEPMLTSYFGRPVQRDMNKFVHQVGAPGGLTTRVMAILMPEERGECLTLVKLSQHGIVSP